MDTYTLVHPYSEILYSNENEQTTATYNMDESNRLNVN